MNKIPHASQRFLGLGSLIIMMMALVTAGLLPALSAASAAPQAAVAANMITGTVTDPNGSLPPLLTLVHLLTPDGSSFGTAQVDDSTGTFNLGPVPNGNYILVAKAPGESAYTPSLPVSVHMMGSPVDVGVMALTYPAVTGTVYAPDGVTPVTAVVTVHRHGHLIQTDHALSGTLKLGGLLTGTYRVQAHPATNDPYWLSPPQPLTITTGLSQTISLTLRPANIAGVVTDPNGVPVSGAVVHVWGQTGGQHRRDETSGTGYFAIGDLAPDAYTLVAEPPWHAGGLVRSETFTFTVPPDFTDAGTIMLRSAPKVVEGVVETNTGIPVANARIIANRLDHPGHQETLSGIDGGYILRLSGGLWGLTVEPTDSSNPGHWVYTNPPLLVHFDDDLEPEFKTVNFEVLTADAAVIGSVAMPDGSPPPFTVTVGLRNNEGHGRHTTIAPADGSFELHVPHGNYILHVQPHDPAYFGPPPQPIYAPISDTLNVGTLTLIERDATISGVVQNAAGEGVGGVGITAWTRDHLGTQTMTNPDGSYVLAVSAGEWQAKPHTPPEMPYVYLGTAVSVTLTSQQHITGVNFTLTEANNQVAGQLVTLQGHPVAAAGWAAAANEGGPVNGAPIDGGSFTIYLPDGDYQVGVHLPSRSHWIPGGPQPVSVSGGQMVSLTVPVIPKNAHIIGALWDPRHEIVPTGVNGHVMADNPFAWVNDAINPANGTYHLGVSAGLWHLSYNVAPSSGYVPLDHHTVVPLEAGQTLAVPLPVAQRDSLITGVVLKPGGVPMPGAVVVADGLGGQIGQVTLRAQTDSNGEFRLHVPYGAYNLHAHHAEAPDVWLHPAQHAVIARPGQPTTGLVLQFRQPDVTLTGTVSLATEGMGDGRVHIWAYSEDGAATHTAVSLGETYELGLLSNMRWHIGAVLETPHSFYAVRTHIVMGSSDETLNLALSGPFPKPGPVVVTFDASQPQHIALADGTDIFVPAGAMPVAGQVTLHITPIATFPHQHHARLYKYGYAFIATDATGAPITSHFNQNVIIRFSYDEAALHELNLREDRLKPAYYSTSTQSWTIPDSYVVDTQNNLVTMQIDHFTDFSLLNGTAVYEVMLPLVSR